MAMLLLTTLPDALIVEVVKYKAEHERNDKNKWQCAIEACKAICYA